MIITCPYCNTRYQVAAEAIGSAGRKVQCAHCSKAWEARPVEPAPVPANSDGRMMAEMNEDKLDALLEAEAKAVALAQSIIASAQEQFGHSPPTPPAAPERKPAPTAAEQAQLRKRQRAFFRRQSSLFKRLPMARVRRGVRIFAALTLVCVLAGAYFLRTDIVRQFPDMAGIYESVGLGVNVVGLDFSDVRTLRRLSGGKDVLTVNARIHSAASHSVAVPPVIVTLIDSTGHPVYEWSVTPQAHDLEPGEVVDFETHLSAPPGGATDVKLTFAEPGTQTSVQ